ncbi:MAG TPA: hypothetical protein VMZ51_00935 [Acidimicrobiales bacterium]|nr:hypothetical protein [Acidimicrobiales bacterium]
MLKADRPGRTTVAKCYRLLRTILNTAVEDEVIVKNPCVVKGAGVERPPERPIATIEQVYALAEVIEPRYRALVLLATFTGLRLGELQALSRRRLDLLHGRVEVVEQMLHLANGTLLVAPPKSDAGRRSVAIPAVIIADLDKHLAEWPPQGRTDSSSAATKASPSGAAPSIRHGDERLEQSVSKAYACMISAIPETPSPPVPAPAPRNSWRGWATPRRGRR